MKRYKAWHLVEMTVARVTFYVSWRHCFSDLGTDIAKLFATPPFWHRSIRCLDLCVDFVPRKAKADEPFFKKPPLHFLHQTNPSPVHTNQVVVRSKDVQMLVTREAPAQRLLLSLLRLFPLLPLFYRGGKIVPVSSGSSTSIGSGAPRSRGGKLLFFSRLLTFRCS